jgi:hypothetical protein
MVQIGYYAKDKNGALLQFEHGADEKFYVFYSGVKTLANVEDFEILEIGYFTADSDRTNNDDSYYVFLMAQLAIVTGVCYKKEAYDILWEQALELYSLFSESEFNVSSSSEYDCIVHFLSTQLPIDVKNILTKKHNDIFITENDSSILKTYMKTKGVKVEKELKELFCIEYSEVLEEMILEK